MRKFLLLALLWILSWAASGVDLTRSSVVALIDGEPIKLEEVLNHARASTHLVAYLHAPNGLPRILADLLQIRLLVREGKRLEMPQSKDESDLVYAFRVRDRLVRTCPDPESEEIEAYYQENPEKFSTPRYTRARRIGIEAITSEEKTLANQRLAKIQDSLSSEALSFAEAVSQFSEDPQSKDRDGDLGFFPQSPDYNTPLSEQLHAAVVDDYIGPVAQGDMVFLYQITGRHEPILSPFDADVVNDATQMLKSECSRGHFRQLMDELQERWPVEYPIPEMAPS